jgi:hypothetical protein
MLVHNRNLAAFATRHRLQTTVAEDGELRIKCGPRRSANHASFGLRDSRWTVFVAAPFPPVGQGLAYLETRLRAAGAVRVVRLDLELFADVAEADFLAVADSSRWTRPRRRVALSPDARAALAAAARRLTVARTAARGTAR